MTNTVTMTGFTFGTLTGPQFLALVGAVRHPGGYTWARQTVQATQTGVARIWETNARVSDSACKALVRRGFLRPDSGGRLYRLACRVGA